MILFPSNLVRTLTAAKRNEATLKARLAAFEATIRTEYGFPARLYANLHEEIRPFVVSLILGAEARHLYDGDKLVTRARARRASTPTPAPTTW